MYRSNRETIFGVLGRDPVHTFPARMAPGIALRAIGRMKALGRVLDPMMGSGTVLALARAKGHQAIGTDIDPLAVLMARVWTTCIHANAARRKAAETLVKAQALYKGRTVKDAYPASADNETRRFIRYWFDPTARKELAALADVIAGVRSTSIRDVLWCGFSRLIIAKQAGASRAMDLSHSRPHRTFAVAPISPFDRFLDAVDRVVDNCIDHRSPRRGPAAQPNWGDARELPVRDNSIDLVLTSPPYLNAIDYLRCSKFTLVWMGYNIAGLRTLRSESIGTEAGKADDSSRVLLSKFGLHLQLSSRHRTMLERYISDMRAALAEVSRVLVDGGKAIYVMGENTVRGTFIPNADIVCALARQVGLRLRHRRDRMLPANRRYLPPPARTMVGAAQLDGRMRREVILTFAKVSSRESRRLPPKSFASALEDQRSPTLSAGPAKSSRASSNREKLQLFKGRGTLKPAVVKDF